MSEHAFGRVVVREHRQEVPVGSANRVESENALQYTAKREEVMTSLGISKKTLRTYQERGLFTPELGARSRGFTWRDVARLQFIERLRNELGLSIDVLQTLLISSQSLPDDPSATLAFLSIERSPKLMSYDEALESIFDVAAGQAININEDPQLIAWIERWMTKFVALRFYVLYTPDSRQYRREHEALMEQLQRAQLACRVRRGYDERGESIWKLAPRLPDDPELSQKELEGLYGESIGLLMPHGRPADSFDYFEPAEVEFFRKEAENFRKEVKQVDP